MINRISKLLILILVFSSLSTAAQHSIAREWNEVLLESIRKDFARPTVHARNLFHTSAAMYDIWATFDEEAQPFCLGNNVGDYIFPFIGFTPTAPKEESLDEAISFAMYRILRRRFQSSPNASELFELYDDKMAELGYDPSFSSTNYTTGNAAALGNYVGNQIIQFGFSDGSNEIGGYRNRYYNPVNPPMIIANEGNPTIINKNRWQPLAFSVFIDQSGNQIPGNVPSFLGPEWGIVTPFSLQESDLRIEQRDNFDYYIYHDPGPPALLSDTPKQGLEDDYIWGHSLVAMWSSHLDKNDPTELDISPAALGNLTTLPEGFEGLKTFYDNQLGGDPSTGYDINPITGAPYLPQMVKRGDYARVLAEFWADGPDSETPPGHWFTLLNYVSDQPSLSKKFNGKGEVMDDLEWDVKTYLTLGGAMHDVAVAVWGLKGYYDYIRPVSAIRAMAEEGQSTDPSLSNYHPQGLPLVDGFIEIIAEGDPLAGVNNVNVGEIKVNAWKGPDFINDPSVDEAGVGWILAKNWYPYQRPTFVTPPFAGYVSGHSTFSRAAAEVLTALTGDPYFPGGVGEFVAPKDDFLVFEQGPSEDIVLQWAKYYDASDQCSLSRIWGGIHPPVDDIPGRKIGIEIGLDAFNYARQYFYEDKDNDGFYSYEDCDDNDENINPIASEICNGKDSDCNGLIDDGLSIFTYFLDADNDNFGDVNFSLDTCLTIPPKGYVSNSDDCIDSDILINPNSSEVCDGIDNDCNGEIDEDLPIFSYYWDSDADGFGNVGLKIDTCLVDPPAGYVANALDCNDDADFINPNSAEICDGIDNDCNDLIDDGLELNRYFADKDLDGFGALAEFVDTCLADPPMGYVINSVDCNDDNVAASPLGIEIADNGIDEDCDGVDLFVNHIIFPTIVEDQLTIRYNKQNTDPTLIIWNHLGQIVLERKLPFDQNFEVVKLDELIPGLYYVGLVDLNTKLTLVDNSFVKM